MSESRRKSSRRVSPSINSVAEQKNSNPYTLAIAYVELGEKDKAFAALEDVFNAHSNFVGYFKIDPQLKPLHDDSRFAALLQKSGFPQ
ncbi:MAG TPA: hypothetical protein VIK24_19720 [Pyrinomonadaceae bacterium]